VEASESSILLDLLFEDGTAGRCLVAPDGKVLRANDRWLRSAGVSLDAALGAPFADLFPGVRESTRAVHERARMGRRVELPPRRQGGEGRDTLWTESIDPVPMAGGVGLLITVREAPRPAAAVPPLVDPWSREGEERFRLLAEAMPQIVCVLAVDGTARYVNSAWTAFSGLDLAATADDGWASIVHPEDLTAARTCRRRVLESLRPQDVELRYRGAGGGYRWFLSRLAPVVEHGQVVQFVGAAMDIDDRLRAERHLREREEDAQRRAAELQAVLDAVPAAVFITRDPSARVIDANRFSAETLRMAPGRNVSASVPVPERPAGFRAMRGGVELPAEQLPVQVAARTGQDVRDYEFDLVFEDGTVRHLVGNATALRGPDGRISGAVGAFLDITERKRMEEAARLSDKRKSEFLGVLSHELRNPLAPIRNSLYLLERAPPESAQAARAKEVIRRQTEHLVRLVEDLLDVTRISRGKIALHRTHQDLRGIVRETSDDMRSLFAERAIELHVECGVEPVWIEADTTRIAQVLGNLLQNSAKFTPRGGSVVVTVSRGDGQAELRVRDTGEGMEPEAIDRMFEPFTQADRTLARASGGLGLGLALVKGLVEGRFGDRARGSGREPSSWSAFPERLLESSPCRPRTPGWGRPGTSW
jgi:PAS domain S-box-containing protein